MSAVDSPSNASILSVRRYTVTPPNNLVIPVEEVIPTSREEEIITKKKTELTTTRQIQTRVKRQVVLEDGKVVEDSGPIVTTNTTEDTEKHEEQNTEHRNLGDGENSALLDEVDSGRASLTVVKKVNEKKVKSREEKEERLETEQVAHLGSISDDLYLKAVQSNSTNQLGLLSSSSLVPSASSIPRIVHQSAKVKKVTDTEDTKHVSQLTNGKLVTQTEKTVEREEVNDLQEPCEEDIEDHESVHEASHHYRKTKDQDLVEYLENGKKIGEKVRSTAENFTGAGFGDPDCLNLESALKWETLSERIRKLKKNAVNTGTQNGTHNPSTGSPPPVEALTQSPVDFAQEESSRRVETSKWLDNHFGSESSASSSRNSTDNGPTSSRTTSFINVTMKSAPPTKSVSPTKLIVTPTETTILPPQPPSSSSPFYRGLTEWKSSIPELSVSADVKDNTSTTQEWKTETDTSSEWRKLSQSRNTSQLSDGSELKKSSIEEHTRVNRVIPIQLYRTNSSSDLPKNSISYKPDITSSGGSLSSLPIYAEVNKKKTRFAPDPTPISRNPDPNNSVNIEINPSLSASEKSKSDFYNRKLSNSAYNLSMMPSNVENSPANANNGNSGGPTVKRRHSTKRASLTEAFKNFVDKLRHAGSKKRHSASSIPVGGSGGPHPDLTDRGEPIVPPRSKHKNRPRKYYLGEDPYGSMYGKEKEYDSVTVYRDRPKVSGGTLPRRSNHHNNSSDTHFDTVTVYKRKAAEPSTTGVIRGGIQTLPRKTSYQTSPRGDDGSDYETVTVYRSRGNSGSSDHRGGIQTLPRKNKTKDLDQISTTSNNSNINVFIVNKRSSQQPSSLHLPTQPPPAKPSRTYRSNLLRSQSFNVTEPNSYSGNSYLYKSNPHLDILEENVAPLKSPSIINNVTNNIRHHTILRS